MERVLDWVHYYNFERPHEALGGRTPAEVYLETAAAAYDLDEEAHAAHAAAAGRHAHRQQERRPLPRRRLHPPPADRPGRRRRSRSASRDSDPSRLDIFVGEQWLGTARPAAHWDKDDEAFYKERNRLFKQAAADPRPGLRAALGRHPGPRAARGRTRTTCTSTWRSRTTRTSARTRRLVSRIKRTVAGCCVWHPSRHYYRDLEGVAAHVATRLERAFLKKAREAVKEGGLLIAGGRPGTGKTHALAMLLEEFPDAIYLAIPRTPPAQQIMAAPVRGPQRPAREASCPPYLVGDPLEDQVMELLLAKRPTLIIDDANFMGDKLVEHFIFLQTYGEFPLLMLGHGLEAIVKRNEALRTRVTHAHAFRRLTRRRAAVHVGRLPPVFRRPEPEVLEFINRRYAAEPSAAGRSSCTRS